MPAGSSDHRGSVAATRRVAVAASLVLLGATVACGATNDTIALPTEHLETVPDAGTSCPGPLATSEGVVALYTFDGDEGRSQVSDVVGGHNGSVQLGVVATVAGPEGCGRAFSFGANPQYIVIDDSPDWDMDVGSIDLWLWLPATLQDHVGVLARDLSGRDQPGHFSLFVNDQGRAIVRVQPQSADFDNSTDAVACSTALLPRQAWVHLGVNFGPPAVELYVDGVVGRWNGANSITSDWGCGQPGAWGIAGNDLPWAVGRATFESTGILEYLEFPAFGCAIDHLRISNRRRDFTATP